MPDGMLGDDFVFQGMVVVINKIYLKIVSDALSGIAVHGKCGIFHDE